MADRLPVSTLRRRRHQFSSFIVTLLLMVTDVVRGFHLSNSLSTCGYSSCPTGDPDKINVHVVSHSHWDVGWVKTVDQYFYGGNSTIGISGVQYIVDTVLDELEKDAKRRFVFVETAYIWRWWNSRGPEDHQRLRDLLQSGQLEIINGGWSMHDEATTHYMEVIDQMTWGLRFLNDTLGECARPKVGWQIDPFGHSRESSSIFAQMGYDGVFLGRVDYQDKESRKQSRSMEFLWQASANLGQAGQVFGVILPNLYLPPTGFCFDILCNDEPIKDNQDLKGYNVDEKINAFLQAVYNQSRDYVTNDLIMTMGQDFNYQSARTWFLNLDKLFKYVNEKDAKVKVFYSTPSCYLKAINEADRTWPVKKDDFLPYGSDPHSYWTGYFSSRPAFKYYTKYTNNMLQVAKQLSAIALLGPDNDRNLNPLRRSQAEAQHHDAITGTEAQHVVADYAESLSSAVDAAENAINNAYSRWMPKGTSQAIITPQQFCHSLNVSTCRLTETQSKFTVTVYNPLAHIVRWHIRVPVTATEITVKGPDGDVVDSQIVPVPGPVEMNPEHRGDGRHDLVFMADLPPLGYSTFFVLSSGPSNTRPEPLSSSQIRTGPVQAANDIDAASTNKTKSPPAKDLVIENEYIAVTVDGATGLLRSVTNLLEAKTHLVSQNFHYYLATSGNNSMPEQRASGAYIFRPNGTNPLPFGTKVQTTLVTGSEVQEIHQNFNDYVSQVIRVYRGEHGVELEWQVGPIPVNDGIGKEVISRFDTDLKTREMFYTDSNGREIVERRRNYRPTWNLSLAEVIAGNYFPVNTRIFIKDDQQDSQLTIMTDRTQGGSSLKDGSLELMVHRRLLHDDGKGVNEALNEPGVDGRGLVVRGKHRLLLTTVTDAPKLHRAIGLILTMPPVITVAPLTMSEEAYRNKYHVTDSGLTSDLPGNVHLLTLEPWKNDSLLLRLEHYYEKTDDPDGQSQPVTVSIKKMFSRWTIREATETTLGANIPLADVQRLQWKAEDRNSPLNLEVFSPSTIATRRYSWGRRGDNQLDVTLQPMQIRTFVINTEEDRNRRHL